MTMALFIITFYFMLFYYSSLHSLMILLCIEMLIVCMFLILFTKSMPWFLSLIFILFAVCLGAYGVSLLVSTSRSKGTNYYFIL